MLIELRYSVQMVPALSFFYGGMVSPKAVVNTMIMSFMCLAVGSVVWSVSGMTVSIGWDRSCS